ncbi:M23 family metallopeptidase [Bosea sp. F3-2]|uniref:M23 family metallopeptidase n=1 Tax=Bosea sp. F3-2 TaxID=2599640 RepID=UPI0011F09AE5|nr:M23 family metallopeptidase [Bosea sp. F3-2]QEL21671.1 M23 family metallopeptidase [Bosea sp. F3-2]
MIGGCCLRVARAAIVLAFPTVALAEEAPVFALPVACELGRSCFIQNYVDADPTSSARDYQCGTLSYDGHNGTDFRLPTMAAQQAGVEVLAAAAGRVVRRRDGVADVSVRGNGAATVKGVECGNAVVIEHSDGWQTQYCHMARGSLRVEVGERVEARQAIGRIGLSGLTEYPHLHFIVRHRGEIADPFAHEAAPSSCGGGRMLWEPALVPLLAYRPRWVLNAGFAAASVTLATLEAGDAEQQPGIDAPALVAYARGIGLKIGDVQSVVVSSPSGQVITRHEAQPLERNQAQTLIFTGLRKPATGWDRGTYRAKYTVSHDGGVVLERSFDIELQ